MIFGHYLTVWPWHPNFEPNQDTLRSLLVWVRFPCLPIEYFDYQFLMKLASKVANLVKVDEAIKNISRGLFVRVCVELDLAKPLLSKFELRRRVRRIENEGIHLICFECGMYGHRRESCPWVKKEQLAVQEQNQDGKSGENQGITRDNEATSEIELIHLEIVEIYRLWMLVIRRTRNSKHTSTPADKKDSVNGNSRNEKVQNSREGKKNQATANPDFPP